MKAWKLSPDWCWRVLPLLVSFLLALIVCRVFWSAGFPYTHDGENHLARFANYAAAVKEGQWPPRFAPYVLAGFGFPVFSYNYPLANILSVPFTFVRLNPEATFAALVFVSTIVGLYCWWRIGRGGVQGKFWSVLHAAFAPYLLSLLFFRGNIGEVLVWWLLPILLALFSWQAKTKNRFAPLLTTLLLASFLLSHNIFAVFLSPWLVLWQLSLFPRKNWLKEVVLPWVMALGLVAWFWLPALLELKLIVLSGDSLAAQASQHGLTLLQLFWSPLQFGFSRPGPFDTLGMGLTPLWSLELFVVTAWGVAQLIRTWPERSHWLQAHAVRWGLLALGVYLPLFLSWEGSAWLWQNLPLLHLMQFPWRWLLLSQFCFIPLAASFFSTLSLRGRVLAVFTACILVLSLFSLHPADRFHKESVSYLLFPLTTLTRNEDRPVTLPAVELGSWKPGAQIATGSAQVLGTQKWSGSKHEFDIQVTQTAIITESTVYFPGWKTTADGKTLQPIFSENAKGLIAYQLEAREKPYHIVTRFGEHTLIRQLADALSIVTVLSLIGWMLLEVQKPKKGKRVWFF